MATNGDYITCQYIIPAAGTEAASVSLVISRILLLIRNVFSDIAATVGATVMSPLFGLPVMAMACTTGGIAYTSRVIRWSVHSLVIREIEIQYSL